MANLTNILIQLFNGVYYASFVYLVAVGFSLIFGIRDLVNIAHAMFLTAGAFLSVTAIGIATAYTDAFIALFLGSLLVIPVVVAVAGIALDRIVFRRVEDIEHNYQLLATFGLTLAFTDIIKLIWGASPISMSARPLESFGSVFINGSQYPVYNLFVIAVAGIAVLLPFLIFKRTKMGKIAQALAEDEEMTAVLGLNTNLVRYVVFGMGAGLAAVAGILLVPATSAYPNMSLEYALLGFAVLVIGGIGNLRGAIVASLLIGIIQGFGSAYFPEYQLVAVFLLMAVVLMIKPEGIYGGQGVLQ